MFLQQILHWAIEQLVGLVFWNNRTLASFEELRVSALTILLVTMPTSTLLKFKIV